MGHSDGFSDIYNHCAGQYPHSSLSAYLCAMLCAAWTSSVNPGYRVIVMHQMRSGCRMCLSPLAHCTMVPPCTSTCSNCCPCTYRAVLCLMSISSHRSTGMAISSQYRQTGDCHPCASLAADAHQSENATLKLAQQNPAGMQLLCHKETSIYCSACLLLCLHQPLLFSPIVFFSYCHRTDATCGTKF